MMGKRLINGENSESQRTTRKLQQLLVIFALLLMPSLAWGQTNYGLTIADVEVTSANATTGITGDGITGTVTYDATNKILTLENATIEDGIVWDVDDDLTVEIKGNNSITSSGTIFVAMKINHSLSFTRGDATNDCKLELNSGVNPVILGFSNFNAPTVTDMFWIPTKDSSETDIVSATITTSLLGGGAGTESDPLVISSFDDLKNFSKYVNCGALTTQYVKLADDLENNTLDCSSGDGFEPIGISYTYYFGGTFDGNNKTISGLTYNASGGNYDNRSALFGFIGDDTHQGTVKNLTLKNCSFTGAENIGGIVAMLKNGTIENCTVDNCILTSGNQETVYVGGIVSDISKGAISGCKVNGGTITGSSTYNTGGGSTYVGGIAGFANTSETISISSCEVKDVTINSTHAYTYGYHLGGIIGYCYSGTITISNNTVKGTTNLNCVDNDISNSNYMYVGAVVGDMGSATYNGNTYESTVKTSKKISTDDAIVLSGQTERGIGTKIKCVIQKHNQMPLISTLQI